jgi:hypothetical protein
MILNRLGGLLLSFTLSTGLVGCNSELPNYSATGACDSLASLINQLGLMEIRDTETFYTQIDSIIAQAQNASNQDAEFSEMASQVESFARVWSEKFPDAVPNYLGTIPLQFTSDKFCGTDFENQG